MIVPKQDWSAKITEIGDKKKKKKNVQTSDRTIWKLKLAWSADVCQKVGGSFLELY